MMQESRRKRAQGSHRRRRIILSSLVVLSRYSCQAFDLQHTVTRPPTALAASLDAKDAAKMALERTAAHLEKLNHRADEPTDLDTDPLGAERLMLYRDYVQRSANALKEEQSQRGLPGKGRKPDLAARLAEDDLKEKYGGHEMILKEEGWKEDTTQDESTTSWMEGASPKQAAGPLVSFAGIPLSEAAGRALGQARFATPSPIQAAAISRLARGESLILHAETGSGKTLAYLLPVTEQLWRLSEEDEGYYVILTPTRELAAQVAGVAKAIAPPGSVRLVSRPTNLLSDGMKDRGELPNGGRYDDPTYQPRLFIGSAKAIMYSLYGDGKMPAPPTTKPEAMYFLENVRCLVLDEVDRILAVKQSRSDKLNKKVHEKPGAVVCAAVARLTLGRAQIVAASATVGRPLRRELARALGLLPQECPDVVHGEATTAMERVENMARAVTIPETVQNHVLTVEGTSAGQMLTMAYKVIQAMSDRPRRMLLVLSRGFDINTQNTIGALNHFKCTPEPQSLLDVLEADGTDRMIEKHREVSGAKGVGESAYFATKEGNEEGYLFVTGEDTVRGIHLDGLDVVIVVGRPKGPDEYMHIAGRTGRAGRTGHVINIVAQQNAAIVNSWESMLGVPFSRLELSDIPTALQ